MYFNCDSGRVVGNSEVIENETPRIGNDKLARHTEPRCKWSRPIRSVVKGVSRYLSGETSYMKTCGALRTQVIPGLVLMIAAAWIGMAFLLVR